MRELRDGSGHLIDSDRSADLTAKLTLIDRVAELEKALAESKQLNILEAVEILKEFKQETEGTDWVHQAMKRATIAGIQSCIAKLYNEAAKR